MNIKKSILLRVRLAFLAVAVFAMLIVWKIGKIQLLEGSKWRKMAEEVNLRYMTVKATRGNIYSDNGSLLATSLPFYKLVMDPTVASDELFKASIDSLSLQLAQFYQEKSATDYKRKIIAARKDSKRYLVLSHKTLNFQQKKTMMQWPLIRQGRLKGGIIFEKMDKRYMPFGQLAYRTVGFVNEDRAGAGLEISYNSRLAGRAGKALFQKMAGNNWKPIHDDTEIKPEQGYDIQTTIDINLQDVAEDALNSHLLKHDADYGCVVLMEVATGEIKAIANLGKNKQGGYSENYNYAVGNQGLTDPGSTFKLASMMALMEEKEVDLYDTINTGNGETKFSDRTMKDAHAYGSLAIIDVFAKSSNVGTSKLIYQEFAKNPLKYVNYLKSFHLDKPIDFQMKGEAQPYLPSPKDSTWSPVSLPWMSIGYEMRMSPLHTLSFYNGVANGGKMIKPMIVKKVWQSDKIIEEYKTEVLVEKLCSDKTLDKLNKMLQAVVDHGTADNIKTNNYLIAGKTGTAQKIKGGKYIKNYYTSFCGFFPADKPKYSCIVVIDSPKGFSQYGADVAAPVFKEVADKIYSLDFEMHRDISEQEIEAKKDEFPLLRAGNVKDLQYLCNTLGVSNHYTGQEEWVAAVPVNNAIMWQGRSQVENLIPNVVGMTLRDALYLLENKKIKVRFDGKGRVQEQSILPGVRAGKGEVIYLKLG